MKAKIKKAQVEFAVTLTEDELLHVEAAVDAFRCGAVDDPEGHLGSFSDRYDSDLVESIHAELDRLRDELL